MALEQKKRQRDAAVNANGGGNGHQSSDSSDEEDELTFTEQQAVDDDEDSDEEMPDANPPAAGANGDVVNVDFVFSDPQERHFNSVKQLLLGFMPPSQPFNVSDLADLVINQASVGTMIGVDEEDDVYAFITALNMQKHQHSSSMQQIGQFLSKKCPADLQDRFTSILNHPKTGLLINERIVNLPYQLVPPLQNALHEDLMWAAENEEDAALRQSLDFEYFVLLASCVPPAATEGSSNGKGKKKAKREDTDMGKVYRNFEDEFLASVADFTFSFDVPRSEQEKALGKPDKTNVVIVVRKDRHKESTDMLANMIDA